MWLLCLYLIKLFFRLGRDFIGRGYIKSLISIFRFNFLIFLLGLFILRNILSNFII